jgi:hypothetical protein
MASQVKFGFPIVTPDFTLGSAIADLGGTLTGTTDGDLADVADVTTATATALALSTSDMYTDSAVNTAVNAAVDAAVDDAVDTAVNGAILDINLQLKEIQTTVNALLASLRAGNIIDT